MWKGKYGKLSIAQQVTEEDQQDQHGGEHDRGGHARPREARLRGDDLRRAGALATGPHRR